MAKVPVSVMAVEAMLFLFGLYFSPCLAMMTGGISRINERNIPGDVKEGVRLYLENITKQSAFDYKLKCDTLEASSQVVEGILYRVALEIVPVEKGAFHSDCIHGSDNFRLEKGDVKSVCLTIWSRPWLEGKQSFIVKEMPHKRNGVESCLEVNSE